MGLLCQRDCPFRPECDRVYHPCEHEPGHLQHRIPREAGRRYLHRNLVARTTGAPHPGRRDLSHQRRTVAL
jgi:hypothetical protein